MCSAFELECDAGVAADGPVMVMGELAELECDLLQVWSLGVDLESYLEALRLGGWHDCVVAALVRGVDIDSYVTLVQLGVAPGSVVDVYDAFRDSGIELCDYRSVRETGCGHDATLGVCRAGVVIAAYQHLADLDGADVGRALEMLSDYIWQ